MIHVFFFKFCIFWLHEYIQLIKLNLEKYNFNEVKRESSRGQMNTNIYDGGLVKQTI